MVLGGGLALDAAGTSSHSQRENPSRASADAALLAAAGASVVAVGVVLFGASRAPGSLKYLEAGFALLSVLVLVFWTLIHTVYTLKYARLYYQDSPGGVTFNEEDPPQHTDFAYLAFTIGMTFQVSDSCSAWCRVATHRGARTNIHRQEPLRGSATPVRPPAPSHHDSL